MTLLKPRFESVERRILLSAYTFRQLGEFGVNATGADPQSALVADANGNLFGTASKGGAYGQGTVFEIPSRSNTIMPLASFDHVDGSLPYGGLTLDALGNLYGTTSAGGTNNAGTVFEIANGSNIITTLAVFNGADGADPNGTLALDRSGNLYGATPRGGASNDGTVFEIPSETKVLTTLSSFGGPEQITGGVSLDASGNLFGTAGAVQYTQYGLVFELARGSNAITTVASFNLTNGDDPQAGLTIDASGNLYGTTHQGGAYYSGTIFEIVSGSANITTLASYNPGTTDAGLIAAPTLDSQGNLYGTSLNGGASFLGSVFEIARGSKVTTTLASFNGSNGWGPFAAVTLDASGNIRGTTSRGGTGDDGTVFEIAHGSKAITVIASFDGTNGVLPNPGVVRDRSGNLYGTSNAGGAYDQGEIFEIAKGSSTITTVASFNGTNGDHPLPELAVDKAGNVYGTTSGGGPNGSNFGTVFEVASGSNTVTTVVAFTYASGGNTGSGLAIDPSGNLYGTTLGGGAFPESGTIFEIANGSTAITTLASFDGRAGSGPTGDLTLSPSGNLYGITLSGGNTGEDTVFELPSGSSAIRTLARLKMANREYFQTGVILDNSGDVYGATQGSGTVNSDTVFEIASGSTSLTTIASFDSSTGAITGRLALDSSGNLYGTTLLGGPGNKGTVFEIRQGSTAITTLMSFNGTNGAEPDAITLDPEGNLYGTTANTGPGNAGIVFELVANTTITLTLSSGGNPSNANKPLSFIAAVSGAIPDGETVTLLDASNHNAVVATGTTRSGSVKLSVPAHTLSPGAHNLVAAYGGDPNYAACESEPLLLTILPAYFRPPSAP